MPTNPMSDEIGAYYKIDNILFAHPYELACQQVRIGMPMRFVCENQSVFSGWSKVHALSDFLFAFGASSIKKSSYCNRIMHTVYKPIACHVFPHYCW